jgi:NTP pyrophosphatase (non-canonical NTP hydrolase)
VSRVQRAATIYRRVKPSVMETSLLLRPQGSLFDKAEQPVGLDEYQQFTVRTDRNNLPGTSGLGFVLLGLFGEVGSLLSALKKKQRDKDAFVAYHDEVLEELGDVLWYFSNAALRAGLSLSTIAQRASATLDKWDYQGLVGAVTFSDLQQTTQAFQGPVASEALEQRLLELAGKVGRLLEDWSSGRIAENRDVLSANLVEIFRAFLFSANDAEVSLNEAIQKNVVKTLGRWPDHPEWGSALDDGFPHDEQLPRRLTMIFKERMIGGKAYVTQQLNDIFIGDQLTDNRLVQDDYRFHDVFHLAFAAILGWSPTLRALLKLKRKSRPEVDENEDGARARVIEEGISTWIFNHGRRNADFRNVSTLDYGLLKAVHELVRGYEVETRPLWQWERAILEGFRIFRELRHHRQGQVSIDLANHSIEFEPLK